MPRTSWTTVAVVTFLAARAPHVSAQVWTGLGNNNLWSNRDNWNPRQVPPSSDSTRVTFDGDKQRILRQPTGNYVLNRITFAPGARSFDLRGELIRFEGANAQLINNSNGNGGQYSQVIANDIVLNSDLTVGGASTGNLRLLGQISGARRLVKNGDMTLTLTGESDNHYTGETVVNRGTLELDKKPGIIFSTTAIPGDLTIGDSNGLDIVRNRRSNQIANSATVTVNRGANWDLNGLSESIRHLKGSGRVDLRGTGTLTILGVDNQGTTTEFSGDLLGTGNLVKRGKDTMLLTNRVIGYTGDTRVSEGILTLGSAQQPVQFGGPQQRTGQVTIEATATLNGSGTIWSNFPVKGRAGGTLRVGNSPGIIEIIGGVEMEPGAILDFTIDGAMPGYGPGYHSQLIVDGEVHIDQAVLSVNLDSAPTIGSPGNPTRYVLIDNDDVDPINGYFAGLPEGAVMSLHAPNDPTPHFFQITYTGGGTRNDVVLSHVPEPASALLLACGLLLGRRRISRG